MLWEGDVMGGCDKDILGFTIWGSERYPLVSCN